MRMRKTTSGGTWDRRSKHLFVRSDGVIVFQNEDGWFIKGESGNLLLDEPARTHVKARRLADEMSPINN